MTTLRPACERGHFVNDWLDSYHSFSFGEYYDPRYMGVSVLRVINQDKVRPGTGFGTHPHNNMEILTYVLRGEVSHVDSMGNQTVIRAGEIQLMSAGSGITHSEYNRTNDELEFLQIWIRPNVKNTPPRYQQRELGATTGLHCIVAPDNAPEGDALLIRQDTRVFRGELTAGETSTFNAKGPTQYLHVIRGALSVQNQVLQSGDGAECNDRTLALATVSDCEFLLFDLC